VNLSHTEYIGHRILRGLSDTGKELYVYSIIESCSKMKDSWLPNIKTFSPNPGWLVWTDRFSRDDNPKTDWP